MDLKVKAGTAGRGKTISVSDSVFDAAYKPALIHQVATAYLAGARSGTKAQKNRSRVAGGGSKPWRQKGMGRARAGTSSSPIWRSGGVTFAAQPKNYQQKVNRKMYRGALRSVLSELVRQERLVPVVKFEVKVPKTKNLVAALKKLKLEQVLIVSDDPDENLYLAARNLPDVDVCSVDELNLAELIGFDSIVMTTAAVTQLEERLS